MDNVQNHNTYMTQSVSVLVLKLFDFNCYLKNTKAHSQPTFTSFACFYLSIHRCQILHPYVLHS
jgi:hypothetical protein